MAEPINVYWAIFAEPDYLTRQSLLFGNPERLIPDLANTAGGEDEYLKCRALNALHKNTYFFRQPYTIEANFEGINLFEEYKSTIDKKGVLFLRNPANHQTITFDLDYQWVLFADESLEMINTPPYMHKTAFTETSYQTSGSFDIGQWFRPVSLTYQMFKGHNKVKFIEGEPICYITLNTERKINLQRFEMNDKLLEIVHGVTHLKGVKPLLSLSNAYSRFNEANRKKLILKEIKANLI